MKSVEIGGINVVKAVVHVTLPIVCSKCGARGESQPIKVEVSNHLSIGGLELVLRKVRLSNHFPVGWGKYYHAEGDKLKCPDCVT